MPTIPIPNPSHNHLAITSSLSPNWRTPDWLFDTLHAEFHFVLDAAADEENRKCDLWFGPGSPLCEDGLVVTWSDIIHGPVFCNPPYSHRDHLPLAPWVAAMAMAGETLVVVGVLPYAPQTKWWRTYVYGVMWRATEIRLFPYRLKFDPPPDYVGEAPGANVNTAIVVWKPSTTFVDPWTPLVRYWDPRPVRTRGTADDPDPE